MNNILVAAELTEAAVEKISDYGRVVFITSGESVVIDGNLLREKMKETNPEVLVVDATRVDSIIIDEAPNLKFIHCTRGNPVNIDLEYCNKKGIKVGKSPGRNANAVAEFTFGLIISLTRCIYSANRRLMNGEFLLDSNWEKARVRKVDDIIWANPDLPILPYYEFQSCELADKTLGLIGFGAIGKLIASKARAFELNILAYDPYITETPFENVRLVSIEELNAESDIISLHAKETPETTNMINQDFLSRMKDGSYLINTSRGKLIDRFALMDALKSKKLAGAAVDVYDYEPLCKDDPLLKIDNLLLTPHIGGASKDVIKHHSNALVKNLNAFFNNEDIVFPYI